MVLVKILMQSFLDAILVKKDFSLMLKPIIVRHVVRNAHLALEKEYVILVCLVSYQDKMVMDRTVNVKKDIKLGLMEFAVD